MFQQIIYRDIFLAPVLSGIAVQAVKMCIYSAAARKFDLGRLFQADGMPNLHAGVFASLSAIVGMKYGYSSILFSVTAIYTTIILHDTMRLKRQKEKQSGVLNTIISNIKEYGAVDSARISRVLQFRPLDVICGAAIGVLMTYILI